MAIPSGISNCPLCGEKLEKGFLVFGSFVKWRTTPLKWWEPFAVGKVVAGKSWGNWVRTTEAVHCNKCELTLFASDLIT
ncbi:MAG: PF20097 family protein [Chloroflexota bacterium]